MSKIPVLMYHNVAPVKDDDQSCLNIAGMTISIDRFQNHMSYIAEHYTAVRMSDMVSWQIGESSLAPNACVITFDDGLLEVYNYAVPVMQNLGLTATFFVIGQSLVSDQPSWLHALYEVLDGYPTEECGSAFAAAIEEYPRHRQFDKLALRSWINEAMSLGYDLVSAGMSAQAQEVYRGVHFRELGPLEYYIIDGFKLNALAWPFRLMRKIAKKVGIGFEVADSLVRVADRVFAPLQQFLYPRILHRAASRFHDFTYQEVDQIRIEQANRDGSDGIRFHRGPEVVNWMLANKWLLETGQADRATTGLKYNFSNTRDLFRYIPVEIFSSDGSEYKGYVVFSLTRVNSVTNIRVLDIDVSNEKDLGAILCLASEYAKRYRADRISAPASVVEQLGGSRLSKLIFRKTIKRYLHRPASDTSPMALYAEEIQLDYCDGDIAFT